MCCFLPGSFVKSLSVWFVDGGCETSRGRDHEEETRHKFYVPQIVFCPSYSVPAFYFGGREHTPPAPTALALPRPSFPVSFSRVYPHLVPHLLLRLCSSAQVHPVRSSGGDGGGGSSGGDSGGGRCWCPIGQINGKTKFVFCVVLKGE